MDSDSSHVVFSSASSTLHLSFGNFHTSTFFVVGISSVVVSILVVRLRSQVGCGIASLDL